MKLWEWLKSIFAKPAPTPAVPAPPPEPASPWLYAEAPDYAVVALGLVGMNEARNINWIMDLFRFTSYSMKYVDKTTPWCAAFVCMLMSKCGYKSTKSAAASCQEKLGVDQDLRADYGVCVWQHLDGGLKGHKHTNISVKLNPDGTRKCVGGNQNNAVTVATYGAPHYKLVAFKKPVKA